MSLIGNIEDFPDNSTRSVVVGHLTLLVVRRMGKIFIYENVCPHSRKPLDPLGGSVTMENGLLIQCQRHAAEFIVESGECVSGPCQGENLRTIPFTLSQGGIYLD